MPPATCHTTHESLCANTVGRTRNLLDRAGIKKRLALDWQNAIVISSTAPTSHGLKQPTEDSSLHAAASAFLPSRLVISLKVIHVIAEFAQIVGLLAAFTSSRDDRKMRDESEFLEWLRTHEHFELSKKIESNFAILSSIKAVLNYETSEIRKSLNEISNQIATVSGLFGTLSELALATGAIRLSDQALWLLDFLHENDVQFFIIHDARAPATGFKVTLSSGKTSAIADSKYLYDDIATLLRTNLLVAKKGDSGNELYFPTRLGRQFANSRRVHD